MPEISVIIPVYNKEKYIGAALRSVLEQPFRDIEVIVVNDGSTDGSLAIINQIASNDGRVRVVDIPNGGVSHARNVGLNYAQGEWIQFLDADDLLEENYLSQAMQILKEHPADILFSGFTMIDVQMKPVKEITLSEMGLKNQNDICGYFIRYQYDTGFFGYISNKLFRRNVWQKSGASFPVGTTLAEDLDFYVKLYPTIERAYFWNGYSFRYLQTEANYTNNISIDYYSQLQIHIDIRTWFQKSGLYMPYRNVLDRKVSEYAYYILFYDNEERKDLSSAFHFLCERADIMTCIVPEYLKGFDRMVLRCLCNRNLPGIKALFAGRNGARFLFRMVKKHG